MNAFERLVLRGLWVILKVTLAGSGRHSGTDEIMWADDVAKAIGDDTLRRI